MVNENFTNYAFGNLGSQGSWVENGNGAEVQVLASPALSYRRISRRRKSYFGWQQRTALIRIKYSQHPWQPLLLQLSMFRF